MDVSFNKTNSIRIKSNKVTLVTDPMEKGEDKMNKIDAQIVLLTSPDFTYDPEKVSDMVLEIGGPGEYEVGGLSIMGKYGKNGVSFTITNAEKVLLAPFSVISKVQSDDEYDAVIIRVDQNLTEDLFSLFSSKCFILYGDLNLVALKDREGETVNKVSLKKSSEIQGKIFLLSA